MIVLKHVKLDSACFISHIDMLRHISRILRRADIPVKFSQGFNPHALVFFSPPLAVGVASYAEYLSIDTDMPKEEVLSRYNRSVPYSISAEKAFQCEKNPNLQARITAADYVFDTAYAPIDLSGGFEIEYTRKGESVKEDVADKIFDVSDVDGKLCMRLANGNSSLRPDRILNAVNSRLGVKLKVTDIKKIAQFVTENGEFVAVDEFLS